MTAAARSVVREFAFSPRDHAAIAALAYAETGIVLPATKSQLVYGRLARRVRACALNSFAEYIAMLGADADERGRAIDALTTNHTSFFREEHHYAHFLATAWPGLRDRLDGGGVVRLWSAACSSGEEVYSLLMAIMATDRGAAARLAKRDLRILATDLSEDILDAARAGRYPADIAAKVPPALRKLWMEPDDCGGATMLAEVRALVAFRTLNLLRDWPMRTPFDAIFCRNVMIYFDGPTKATLQAKLADQLVPGGFLYIGHSEHLVPAIASRFECVGRTMFRKIA